MDFETAHAGESCGQHPCKVACALSANAFGKETVHIKVEPPSWWKEKDADATILTLPPYTACTWCYEAMHKNDIKIQIKKIHQVIDESPLISNLQKEFYNKYVDLRKN